MPSQLSMEHSNVFNWIPNPGVALSLITINCSIYWKLLDRRRLCWRCISAVGGLGYLQQDSTISANSAGGDCDRHRKCLYVWTRA